MASSYSSRIRLEKQGTGENANTWGARLNSNMIDLVDAAIAGVTAVDVDGQGGSGVTLTANDGSTDQARSFGLRMTGALSADVTVTYSTAPEKIYFVNNETTGGHNVIMNNGSTKVTVGAGPALVATNGSNSYVLRGGFESGTRLAFNQNTAPDGWTVITSTSHENAALRIVNAATSGGQVGGNQGHGFTDVFNSGITVSITGKSTETATLSGSTGSTAITTAQMPAHRHFIAANITGNALGNLTASNSARRGGHQELTSNNNEDYHLGGAGSTDATVGRTSQQGSGSGHSHSLSGLGSHSHTVSIAQSNAFNLNVKYVNFIVCEKD
tara:strand:+ start:426 stop:1406 length:981 start_codon:yes stop_codon:yes gene_type:complete